MCLQYEGYVGLMRPSLKELLDQVMEGVMCDW